MEHTITELKSIVINMSEALRNMSELLADCFGVESHKAAEVDAMRQSIRAVQTKLIKLVNTTTPEQLKRAVDLMESLENTKNDN